jgi:hypothetical protein
MSITTILLIIALVVIIVGLVYTLIAELRYVRTLGNDHLQSIQIRLNDFFSWYNKCVCL